MLPLHHKRICYRFNSDRLKYLKTAQLKKIKAVKK
jgi:hypothetical protein